MYTRHDKHVTTIQPPHRFAESLQARRKVTRSPMARTRSTETRQRDARALGLRQRGLSYTAIRDELGFSAVSSAHAAVRRAIGDCYREAAGEAVQLELERLDDVYRTLYRVMLTRHPAVSSSGKVVVGGDGQPMYDDAVNVQAGLAIMRVSESRRKLLGIDAPARSRVTVVTEDDLDAELARLADEIARAEADLDTGPGGPE